MHLVAIFISSMGASEAPVGDRVKELKSIVYTVNYAHKIIPALLNTVIVSLIIYQYQTKQPTQ